MIINNIKKTIYYINRNGIKETFYAVCENLRKNTDSYTFSEADETELESERAWSEAHGSIKFSVVVPAYNTPAKYLEKLVVSMLDQTYSNWELVIADASTSDDVQKLINRYSDERIKLVPVKENKGISDNTNVGIDAASGDYVGLLDHDDYITKDCLYRYAYALDEKPQAELLFSNEDKCDSDGTRFFDPNIKMGFNFDLLLSNNYICHFSVFKAELIKGLKLRREYDGAQDYDLILRSVGDIKSRMAEEDGIVHIDRVLYHWRSHENSTATNPSSKLYAYEAGKRALEDFASANNWKVTVSHLRALGFYKVNWTDTIFSDRPEIAAFGGRISKRGKIVGGAMSADGTAIYAGVGVHEDGYMHRAILSQTVPALDLRSFKLRPELCGLFKYVTGMDYKEAFGKFDVSDIPEGEIAELSLKVSCALTDAGYKLLFIPES